MLDARSEAFGTPSTIDEELVGRRAVLSVAGELTLTGFDALLEIHRSRSAAHDATR